MISSSIAEIFSLLGSNVSLSATQGLQVTAPADGASMATLAQDDAQSVAGKIEKAAEIQKRWRSHKRSEREELLVAFTQALAAHSEPLARIIHLEGGKTIKEGHGEATGAADVVLKTIKDAALPEFSGMLRVKERPPVGVVGLITSFNFPMAVAHWTIAPALLAANAVVWKPSEKTPLTALAVKAIFDKVAGIHSDLLQVIVGGREVGEALVAHEGVDMISATGSVAMGDGIKKTLAAKKNNAVKPILELGGNNGVIISNKLSPEHLEWSLAAIMNSFLGTTGQRCTNTRRLIVHDDVYPQLVVLLARRLEEFLLANIIDKGFAPDNAYGYHALIDEAAFIRFEQAKTQVAAEGGQVQFGKRLFSESFPHGFYVEPALATLPSQGDIMHRETFAPILFVTPSHGDIDGAIALLNAPDNAGLVAAIYTQNQAEADRFAATAQAGHVLINPPKGTGTPAHGMGFGGNKHSGTGEILNSADPLAAFTRGTHFTRIAQNKDVTMNS